MKRVITLTLNLTLTRILSLNLQPNVDLPQVLTRLRPKDFQQILLHIISTCHNGNMDFEEMKKITLNQNIDSSTNMVQHNKTIIRWILTN